MKKEVSLLVFLFSIVILSVFIGAATFTVTDTCDAGKKVMGLSDLTNAHGELSGQGNYGYYLCADFEGSTTCDEPNHENKVIGLSGDTNAHGEIPELNNYNSDVCFSGLRCVNMSESDDGGCNGGHPFEVLSLSSETNAHLGDPNNYDQKVCCYAVGTSIAFWTSKKGNEIDVLNVLPSSTQVELVFKNTDLVGNENVDFTVEEGSSWSQLGTLVSATVDPSTKEATVRWTIPDGNWNVDDIVNLRFKADQGGIVTTSPILAITILDSSFCGAIVACSQYTEINNCAYNPCSIVESEIQGIAPTINCLDGSTACYCSWDTLAGSCNATFGDITVDENGVETVKECTITVTKEDPDVIAGGEACDDGFIEYSYTSSCDPLNERTNSLACPAQVELPFFGFYNFVITMLVIALIYYFVAMREHRRKK